MHNNRFIIFWALNTISFIKSQNITILRNSIKVVKKIILVYNYNLWRFKEVLL